MSRDDSLLYSGATSASFSSPRLKQLEKERQQAKDERKEKGQKLKPSAEVVNAILDTEKANVVKELANLPYIAQTSKDDVKSLLLGYQHNLRFIDSVRSKINTALREANNG